MHGDVIRASTK